MQLNTRKVLLNLFSSKTFHFSTDFSSIYMYIKEQYKSHVSNRIRMRLKRLFENVPIFDHEGDFNFSSINSNINKFEIQKSCIYMCFIVQSSVLAVLFVLTIFDDCMGIQVVDISRRHTPVGNYGPALTNFIPHHIHPYGFADVFIGPLAGTTSIGLNTGIFRAHGFIPHRHQYDG